MVQGWVYVGIALYLVWAPSTYPYYIMLLCSRGDDGDVQMKICRLYTARTDASPERHLTPLGATTVPSPPHSSALGVPGEGIAADAQLSERGSWRGALPGTDQSLTGNEADPCERKDSQSTE